MNWIRYQNKRINDLVDKAINDGYLIPKASNVHPASSEIILTTDWRGRNFLKPLPFPNAVLKENGYIFSFILGSGGTLLFTFWDQLIEQISHLLV